MNRLLPIPGASGAAPSGSAVNDRSAAQVSPDAARGAGFGRHFDDARKQGGGKADAPAASVSSPDARKAPASPRKTSAKSSGASGKGDDKTDGKPGDKTAKHGDGQSLAAVMLDLFGAARQALPQDAAAGTTGSPGPAGTTAAAVTGAAWSMAALAIAPGDVAAGLADAAGQVAAGDGVGDTAEGDGAQAVPGGLAAVLAAVAPAPAGSLAHTAGVDSVAPHQDDASAIDSMAVNGLAAGVAQGANPPVHALNVAAPAGSAPFAQELGQQIVWLGGQTLKQASIRLNPEQLGALDVKVSVSHDGHVDVSFTAQHPAAVTAVQQSLGQLDLMLAGQGLSLGQAQVGQQGSGHQGNASDRHAAAGEADAAIDASSPVARPAISAGLLDTFA